MSPCYVLWMVSQTCWRPFPFGVSYRRHLLSQGLSHQPHTDSRGMCQGLQLKLSAYLKVYISQSVFPTWKQLKSQLYSIAVCGIQNACMASKEKLWKTATALAGEFLEGRADPVLTAQPKIHWKMLYRYCQCTCLKSRFWKISSCKLLYKSQAIFP